MLASGMRGVSTYTTSQLAGKAVQGVSALHI
jgi:hypothetical protein